MNRVFMAIAIVAVLSAHAEETPIDLVIGGKKLTLTPIPGMVALSIPNFQPPAPDPNEESVAPFVTCTFESKGKLIRKIGIGIHPDDSAQAKSDYSESKGPYTYKAIIFDNDSVIWGDEKKVRISYKTPGDDLSSNPAPFEAANTALFLDGKYQWWFQANFDGTAYFTAEYPRPRTTIGSKTKQCTVDAKALVGSK